MRAAVTSPRRSPGARRTPRPLTPNEERAERLAELLDGPVTAAGFVFLAVVVADAATPPDSALSGVWPVVIWVLWGLFVVEFLLRMVVARSTLRFLRRNWWQLLFLAVPFLRFMRVLSRTARLARLGSSSVRSTRTARAKVGSRLVLLGSWTTTVVLAGATALFELGAVETMRDAVYVAALAGFAGQPEVAAEGWARLVMVALVLWSAVGFATLAGTLGAYLLEEHQEARARERERETAAEEPGA